jgi:Zn-dependent protease with chaperone function
MLRHEAAHVTLRDNLKRFAMRASPDFIAAGSAIERAWSSAAEEAADAAAVAEHPSTALALADALIRVARLAPPRTPELASAFYLGGSIESRVRRLVAPDSQSPQAPSRLGRVLLIGGSLCIAAALFVSAPLLHQAMETLVATLP